MFVSGSFPLRLSRILLPRFSLLFLRVDSINESGVLVHRYPPFLTTTAVNARENAKSFAFNFDGIAIRVSACKKPELG